MNDQSEETDPAGSSPDDPADVVARRIGFAVPGELVSRAELAELDRFATDELRSRRQRCERAEEAVSYTRRLLQGRLDLLRAELSRRDDPAATETLRDLSRVLAGDDRTVSDPAHARATRIRMPEDGDRYAELLDTVVDESTLLHSREVDLATLQAAVDGFAALERDLSVLRRALFDRIDALRDELAARYKDGRAEVGELLR
ncbi:MAG: hypothetical protein JJT89_13925 [Nitriliruptoraceae bacterium]|nr:hypothetical protein [Nitriliruptoraceae bacterium]